MLHTENDALRLGRALETVYACDDILVVDHGSRDATVRVAREYGAHVVDAVRRSVGASIIFAESTQMRSPIPDGSCASLPAKSLTRETGGEFV